MDFYELLKKLEAAGITFDRFVTGPKGTTLHFPVKFSPCFPFPEHPAEEKKETTSGNNSAPVWLAESLRTIFCKHQLEKGSHFLESVCFDEFFSAHVTECSCSVNPSVIDTDENGVIISVRQKLIVFDTSGSSIAHFSSLFYPGKDGKTINECRIESIGFKMQMVTLNGRMWENRLTV